ncbi:MAG: hypothetical protein JWP19_1852 [Rhodoglobus sp.]|jgi:hypothetical protein|nr:hypothetical protein [Rhodoglobus sp.]
MTHMISLLVQAAAEPDGINPWGMLGCALTYAAAMFAAVDAIADQLLRKGEAEGPRAVHALRLKMGSKLAAAAIAVLTAAIVLIIDNNWAAFAVLSVLFAAIVAWVYYVYRQGSSAPR